MGMFAKIGHMLDHKTRTDRFQKAEILQRIILELNYKSSRRVPNTWNLNNML